MLEGKGFIGGVGPCVEEQAMYHVVVALPLIAHFLKQEVSRTEIDKRKMVQYLVAEVT